MPKEAIKGKDTSKKEPKKESTSKKTVKKAQPVKKVSEKDTNIKHEEKEEKEKVVSKEKIAEEKEEVAEEKHEHIKEKAENRKPKKEKAQFIQRFVAFLLDILIVSTISSIIAFPFIDNKEADKLSDETIEIIEKYSSAEISLKTYTTEMMTLSYRMARNNGLVTIITLIVEVLYFIVYQIYNNGQTLAKKLLKIQVVSKDGKLTMNQMIFRSLIINSILLEIISFGFMLFANKSLYFFGVAIFESIQYIVLLVSAFMVMFSKSGQGLHDRIAHTEVVKL